PRNARNRRNFLSAVFAYFVYFAVTRFRLLSALGLRIYSTAWPAVRANRMESSYRLVSDLTREVIVLLRASRNGAASAGASWNKRLSAGAEILKRPLSTLAPTSADLGPSSITANSPKHSPTLIIDKVDSRPPIIARARTSPWRTRYIASPCS